MFVASRIFQGHFNPYFLLTEHTGKPSTLSCIIQARGILFPFTDSIQTPNAPRVKTEIESPPEGLKFTTSSWKFIDTCSTGKKLEIY